MDCELHVDIRERLMSIFPAKNINNQPVMPDIKVSENGVLKLLKDLNPHKAAGPDELKPLVLRELREVIAPMLVVIF